jgi:diguanylate cyclase
MFKDHYQHLTLHDIEPIIQALEQAVAEHSRWLSDWHRSLICGFPVAEGYLAKDAYRRCEFGQWYYSQSGSVLRDHVGFGIIDRLHRAMHHSARFLVVKAKHGKAIAAKDYDSFIEKELELSERLLKLRDELREILSGFDLLTGVFNRQAFYLILSQEHARVLRTAQPCCISMADLDHFKTVNDTYGHPAGDKVLRATAQYLNSKLRPYDSICRYGGEEFLICLPNTSTNVARNILNRLRAELALLPIALGEGERIKITASFGVVNMASEISINDTIARSDKALYASKLGGRNQVTFCED